MLSHLDSSSLRIDAEPECSTTDFPLAKVHSSGQALLWLLVARRAFFIAADRSQADSRHTELAGFLSPSSLSPERATSSESRAKGDQLDDEEVEVAAAAAVCLPRRAAAIKWPEMENHSRAAEGQRISTLSAS